MQWNKQPIIQSYQCQAFLIDEFLMFDSDKTIVWESMASVIPLVYYKFCLNMLWYIEEGGGRSSTNSCCELPFIVL